MTYSVLDLFAGCGGLGYGFKVNKNFKINLANDIWEPAKDTYTYNNPNIPFILKDIAELNEEDISQYFPNGVDVIIGGPPCQGFSMCGVRNINDERNDLFYEYARIVKMTNPYIFVMENVKGLLSMKNKEGDFVIDAIYKEFKKIGYKIQHKVLNSKYYNVPQSRERVILVGIRNDLDIDFEYPEKILDDNNLYTVNDALFGLNNINSKDGELSINNDTTNKFYELIKSKNEKIYNHEVPSHKPDVTHRMSFVPHGGNWQDIPEEFRVGGIHSNAYRRLDPSIPSVTIKHAYKSMIIHPYNNRCLSIREVARLQSFKDDYIFKNSKTSQYQQIANAVPPNLSIELAKAIDVFLIKNNIENKTNSYSTLDECAITFENYEQIRLF